MTGSGAASSGERRGVWEATDAVLRIAKVGLSLASAIITMTATSKQCMSPDGGGGGSLAGTAVSYTNYGSFQYAALASLVSAVLQGVAIWLEVIGKEERWVKTVELIDKFVQALTATSAALLLAVDDITSCGPPWSRGGGTARQRRQQQTRSFDAKLGLASITGLSAVVMGVANDVVKKVKKELPAAPPTTTSPQPQPTTLMPRHPPSPPPLPLPLRPPPSPPRSSIPPLPSPRSPSPSSPPSSPPSPFRPPLPPRGSPPHSPTDGLKPTLPPREQPPSPTTCTCGCNDDGCDGTDPQTPQFVMIIMMLIVVLLFYRLCNNCSR